MRIGHRLALGRLTYQRLAVFGVGDDRGCSTTALSILNNFGCAIFHNGDAGVGGPQVNTDNLAHV